MQMNGSTLYQISMAGEWRSPSFMSYMDLMELKMGATMEAHMAEFSYGRNVVGSYAQREWYHVYYRLHRTECHWGTVLVLL